MITGTQSPAMVNYYSQNRLDDARRYSLVKETTSLLGGIGGHCL